MSDFDIDWGMEDGLHVDHDGGVDLLAADHQFDHQHEFFDGTDDDAADVTDLHHFGDVSDESQYVDETDLPELQLDEDFGNGSYDLLGADPDEEDLWSQLMLDMNDDVNPYAAN